MSSVLVQAATSAQPLPGKPRSAPGGRRARTSGGPAPIYQLKVVLRDTKPPIWRRLEVPADISLAGLHEVMQIAFDWWDYHLHVFQTSDGDFGIPDPELGYRTDSSRTLEQVAKSAGNSIRYTYDFGDDWEHHILVEKVLERDAATIYPRCTDGRRAAPPEDCGGVWGYADLVQILSDPTHPEHGDRLKWLGLVDNGEFDPDFFDADEVTEALSGLTEPG